MEQIVLSRFPIFAHNIIGYTIHFNLLIDSLHGPGGLCRSELRGKARQKTPIRLELVSPTKGGFMQPASRGGEGKTYLIPMCGYSLARRVLIKVRRCVLIVFLCTGRQFLWNMLAL